MKHSKLLLLPLLFMVSSCVSISQQPQGPSFNGENGELGDDPRVTYYDEGVLGDEIPAIPADAKILDFKNEAEKVDMYKDGESILADKDFQNHSNLVQSYEYNFVGKGIYGIKLDYTNNQRNNYLKVNLKEGITARYVSVNCSPAYYNTPVGNKYEFSCEDAAIQTVREGDMQYKFVKLKAEKNVDPNDAEQLKSVPTVYNATFDLGSNQSSFSLKCYSWSVVINSITFF